MEHASLSFHEHHIKSHEQFLCLYVLDLQFNQTVFRNRSLMEISNPSLRGYTEQIAWGLSWGVSEIKTTSYDNILSLTCHQPRENAGTIRSILLSLLRQKYFHRQSKALNNALILKISHYQNGFITTPLRQFEATSFSPRFLPLDRTEQKKERQQYKLQACATFSLCHSRKKGQKLPHIHGSKFKTDLRD